MSRYRSLLSLIGVGVVVLAACSLALGYATSYFDSEFQPLNALGLTASGVLMASMSFVFGLPVVVLYGVPIYVALASSGKGSWLSILSAATLPCLVAAVFAWQAGVLIAAFALPIAATMWATHGAGPNNSFKPTPLRGAA